MVPFGIHYYEFTGDGKLLFLGANHIADTILGINHTMLVGKERHEAFPAFAQINLPTVDSQPQKIETVVTFEYQHPEKPNDIRILEMQTACIEKRRIVSLFRDITDRLHAEHHFVKLSRAIEQSPTATLILSAQGKIEYVNPRFTELTGYSLEEVVGKSSEFLQTERTAPLVYRSMMEFILEGKEWRGELVSRKKSGELYYEDVKISPMFDEQGELTHQISVREDITSRKRMEERLKKSEEKYRQFFEDDLTGDFISMVDGRILECNPAFAAIYGFPSVEDALRNNLSSLFPSGEKYREFLRLLSSEKKLIYYELGMQQKDRAPLFVVMNVIGMFNAADELAQIRGYVFNDTDRRMLEEQLRQAQKMEVVGTLAGGIAHDFNNILNNIIGFASQIKKHANDPLKIQRYCDTVEKSAARGAQITNQLLMFSRHKKQENELQDVGAIAKEVAMLVSETFSRSIDVKIRIADALRSVRGDRGALYQVLLNLCVNARDAMPSGGTLTLEVKNAELGVVVPANVVTVHTQYCIMLCVQDTGVGITNELLPKIFDPFFTTKEKGHGTGLGLSIVYNAVKEHGGSVAVESVVEKGTIFTVYLPAYEPAIETESFKAGIKHSHGNNELILLVDDEESMRQLGKELLEEYGYRVMTASDGVEALELYTQCAQKIALVILDLIMPRKDGGQTYIEMKEINKDIKAVFCSGYTSDKVITQLLQQENLHAIQKPFHPDDFLKTINEVLYKEHHNNLL
jgi:PAS domain S-box-containing protein